MARKALTTKCERKLKQMERAAKEGRAVKFPTRAYHRCKLCGRPRGYMRHFQMCRICFRELASKGEIVGVRKASW